MKSTAPNLEHQNVPVYQFKVLDEEKGIVEAIVSVTGNKDSGKDIVMPGFFADSLKSRMPKGVWGHDWLQPVAKTLEADEWPAGDARLPDELKDLGGYYVKGQFNLDTQRGREAYSDIKFGIIDEFSIGYSVQESNRDKEKDARQLVKGTWFEWSPVLVGMNDQTQLLSVKAEGEAKGVFEDAVAEDLTNPWYLFQKFMQIYCDLRHQAMMAEMPVDEAIAREAVDEFSARLLDALLMPMDPSEMSGMYYMGRSPALTKLLSGEGKAASALTLAERSNLAASAGKEFAQNNATLLSALEQLGEDCQSKLDARTKAGRMFSQANIDAMQSVCDSIDPLTEGLGSVKETLMGLIDKAKPTEKVSPAEANALRTQTLRLQSRALGVAV